MRIQALRKGVGCLLSCAVLSGCAREAPPVSAESVCASSSVSVSSVSTGQTVSSAPSTVPDTSGPAGRSTVTRAAVTTAGITVVLGITTRVSVPIWTRSGVLLLFFFHLGSFSLEFC